MVNYFYRNLTYFTSGFRSSHISCNSNQNSIAAGYL